MKTFVVIWVSVAGIAANAADSSLIVKVNGGQVRGATLDKGEAVFKGMPYAALRWAFRWREPMPVRSWPRVRDATAFGPPCAQVQNSSPAK